MKRIYILVTFIIFGFYTSFSQTRNQSSSHNNNAFDKSKLELGGSFGLQFSSDLWLVNISPQVGYQFSKYFSAGAGLGYTYYSDERHDSKFSQHYASFNLYGTFYPASFLVFSVKPEISRMWQTMEYKYDEKHSYNKFVPSVVVGGGVRFGPLTAQIKYDVIQDSYSPYGNTVFYSIGYVFSL